MTAGLILYNALATLAFLACWPVMLALCLSGRRGKWRDRCGGPPRAAGRPVWVHASSVGEVNAVAPLVARLLARSPARPVVVSTMTETGQRRARELFGDAIGTFYFPFDFCWTQDAALRRLEPSLVVLVETELWPNLLWRCSRRGVPVVLANARLSERSLPHYRRAAFLFRPLLNTMRAIACQSEADAGRHRSLGVRPEIVRVLGNMKYDAIKGPVTPGERKGLRSDFGIPGDSFVLAAGSTREGEEVMLLDAWAAAIQNAKCRMQNATLVVAPRHPERFAAVEALLKERAIPYVTRSRQRKADDPAEFDVLLLDTLGELVDAYAASDLAFVGGSLVPVGGHNPLEPAALGLPVIFGPHMFNAQDSADSLLNAGGAVQVGDAAGLARVVSDSMADAERRAEVGRQARRVVDERRGATERTLELVAGVLT
ncbi:MAG: 3-deoxy-D-manno-octulosonic acid transferase [Candidatus Edwardsbacteria bacterium]|nr:3-deoxy-D-manno-octulosonic acid transferase [Candidatus Edwardsbacteria bacterium]